jgi:hypothetical protein
MSEEVISLLEHVERCRRLARTVDDERTRTALLTMTQEYESRAESLLDRDIQAKT